MALLTVEQVAQWLGVGKTTVFELLRRGDLRRLKIGAATRIDARDVESFISNLHGDVKPSEPEPVSAGQLRAFHAMAGELDGRKKLGRGTTKREALTEASRRFGRQITSSAKLSSLEASEILDLLEEQLIAERG